MVEHRPISGERKRKLDELFESFSLIAEGTHVYLCDMRYDYTRWSKSIVDTFGMEEYTYAAGDKWEQCIHPEDRDDYHSDIEKIFTGESKGHDMQYRARRLDGNYDVCTCRGIVIMDENGVPEYFGGAIRNHDEKTVIDSLCGLRNQYGFFDDIIINLHKKQTVRITMIGLGRLTEINEVYGYEVGNKVIQKFSSYFKGKISDHGCVYRLDGAKFAVISEPISFETINAHYEKLRNYFRRGLHVEDTLIALELNAGTLLLEDFNTDDQTVYACLNLAYAESKMAKQGDVVEFQNQITQDGKKRLEKLHVIRNSITQKLKGFYLLYQPVVSVDTEEIIGAEALLRWANDEYGMVPPDSFIPVVERDPQFPILGEWIIKTAIEGAKEIRKKIPDFVVNVNLSYSQMQKMDFTETVLRILRETDYPAEGLCLEITERCRMLDMNLLLNIMATLKSTGIKFALDDFGTGFSSMTAIKNLPFDTIKIDKSFVQGVVADEKERNLLNSFVDVAGIFGAEVCVEGVETAEVRDILKTYNLHSLQGYFYSKPIQLNEFIEKVDNK